VNGRSNDFVILEIKNNITTPFASVNLIVYDYSGGTIGEVEMKVFQHLIPPHVDFLNKWLWEIQVVFEGTDIHNEDDWTQELKDMRMKQFGKALQKIVIKILNCKKKRERFADKINQTFIARKH